MRLRFLLIAGLSLVQSACSTNRIIRDQDYETSINAYSRGDVAEALKKFPQGEDGGLITSVEKSWLSLWDAQWNPQPLQRQVDSFDSRKYISLSREAGYFLFQEAEEGYVPAEHEIVILHLLSATHFLQLGKKDDGMVELRRAGYILDRYWDDAALRLWLGSLWASAGEWQEAQVDFRRANALEPNPELAKIAEGPPVRNLYLQFYGIAPLMKWKEGQYTPDFLQDPNIPNDVAIRASTLPWFERHSRRNSDLRDTLIKSNFMAQYLGGKAVTGTERGLSFATTFSIKAMAVAIGVAVVGAIVYIAAISGSTPSAEGLGYMFGAGIGTGTAIWEAGDQLGDHMDRSIDRSELSKREDLKIYRLTRYLPGWIGLSLEQAPAEITKTIHLNKLGDTQVTLVNHF